MDFLENVAPFFNNRWFFQAANTYHGLLNQGATCYLNSVLQVLFMTKDFREAVERHASDNPDTERIDRQLASLFKGLTGCVAYTYEITEKLGIDNVYEQRDAAEYFEKILGRASPEASQIFHGELTHKTICSACRAETGVEGPFWHLPLALMDSYGRDYSVVDGIKEYLRASDLRGENQMYCDGCDAKSDATITCVMKRHPDVLMLLLKRFEFDYRYMSYVKINCTVDVPYTLQIPTNQTYELYAVVDHFGGLTSGHYIAKIKSQDDEKWYIFNDDRVTLQAYQPLKVDNCESSSSAYLLFYRKKTVYAADSCAQDIKIMSTPGGFPPAACDIRDQCRDAGKIEEREEDEMAAGAGNEPVATVPIEGIKDFVSIEFRGEGLSSDLYKEKDQDSGVYARQSIPYNQQECTEERHDLRYLHDAHAEKLRHEGKIMTDDEEDRRQNADAQAETRETLCGETQLDRPDAYNMSYCTQKYEQEGSSMYPQQVSVDIQKDEERMVIDINRDKDRRMEGDEQQERRGTHHNNEGLDDVRHNLYEDQEGTQDVGQDYDRVDRRGDGEREKIDDEVSKEGKSGRERLLTRYDLFQDNGRVGDNLEDMLEDDQRRKQRIYSRFYPRCEQQREEKREQQKRDDKCTQGKGASERQQDQKRGLDDVRQNRSEHITTHKDAAKEAKEQERKGENERIQRGMDFPLRPAGLAGSSRVTENRRDGSVEISQPKAKANEDTKEGRRGSKQSKTFYGKIIEEETHSGVQRSSKTRNIRIETVAGTSRGGIKSWVEYNEGNVKSDPETDAKVTLLEGVGSLELNDSEPQKHRVMSDAQVTVGKEHQMKIRGKKRRLGKCRFSPLKQNKKEKKKRHKTPGCFSFWKSQKNAAHTSESD